MGIDIVIANEETPTTIVGNTISSLDITLGHSDNTTTWSTVTSMNADIYPLSLRWVYISQSRSVAEKKSLTIGKASRNH